MRSKWQWKKIIIFGVIVVLVTAGITVLIFSKNNQENLDILTMTEQIIKSPFSQKSKIISGLNRQDLLLPDLTILPPTQLRISNNQGSKILRFDTTFVNLGPGALEIFGHHDVDNEVTFATQYIYAQGAHGEFVYIGTFEYHPTHKHWHLENHVEYQLWSAVEGEKQELLAVTDKMSFCLWDEATYDLTIENAPQNRTYTSNCDQKTQGVSVGWKDTYHSGIDGQELGITDVLDGVYILRYGVNPDHKIYEVDYENNWGEIMIKIEGFRVEILQ
jgi:hypothetical protein